MSPELLNYYVDKLINASLIFILTIVSFSFLGVFLCRIKNKWTNRKRRRTTKDDCFQELLDSANRKTQVINRQIQSLDKCSERIEDLIEIVDKKIDHFTNNLDVKLEQFRKIAGLLKDMDNSIKRSATSISNNTDILERRDKELQDEIKCLLSLEGKTGKERNALLRTHKDKKVNKYGLSFNRNPENAIYLDSPIDMLPMPSIGKRALKTHFKCENLEDVLSVMLLQQRKGLLQRSRNIGKKSVVAMEDYFSELGLLIIKDKCYTSEAFTKASPKNK